MCIRWGCLLLVAALLGGIARAGAAQSGTPVYNPANGHWYQLVRVAGQINWPEARNAAQALSYAGYPGHLATITSPDEAQFINASITGRSGLDIVWLGGYQDSSAPDYYEPDGGWRWVTGEPWIYTNWHSGEPNDSPHNSNALELAVIWGGQWDDRLADEAFLPGYVVEFEPSPPGTPGQPANGAPVFDPANGHWYQLVRTSGAISWTNARAAAGAVAYAGYPGHLATVTSAAENQFVSRYLGASVLSSAAWIGGYQDPAAADYHEPDGGWRWVTGEPWSYTSWHSGEPSNSGGAENHLETYSDGTWNDADGPPVPTAYLVEFEPAVSPPAVNGAQLVLFPNPTLGGEPALGEVVLSQPAGPGGLTVTLTSSSPAAAVPAGATVLAGASSVTFLINTQPVSVPTAVTITAGCSFGSATAVLQLLPVPGSPPAGGNLLVNGSFEQPVVPAGRANQTLSGAGDLPGWRILRGTVDVVPSLPSDWQPAPDGGRQSLDLVGTPGAATIEQAFPTQPGQDYVFSGWVSHNYGIPEGRANVFLNGAFFVQLYHNTANAPQDMKWTFFSYPFRATAATTTLTLSDVTNLSDVRGTALDGLSVTLASGPYPPVVNPAGGLAAPANLTATVAINARVRLAWTDSGASESGFALWRKVGGSDWTKLAVVPANTTAYIDAGVSPSTFYTYRVQATSDTSTSDWSNEANLTTPAAPTAPTGLTATATAANQITLSWSVNPSNSTAVELYCKGGGAEWKLIAVLAPGSMGYQDRNAVPGTTYTYRLRAANDYFASGWSNEVVISVPAGL